MRKKTFIIAEAGVNHNGEIKNAYKLIAEAKKAGADAVKFQAYITDELCIPNASLCSYQKKTNFKSQYDLLKKYELNQKDIIKLSKYALKKKIKFLLSYFDTKSLGLIKKIKSDYIKIPSGEINNFLLLNKISKLKKNVILSTGMSSYKEIAESISLLKSKGLPKNKISILYCVSSYPTKLEDFYLPEIQKFKKKFNLNIGFSDHSAGVEAAMISVALGAKIIEKHITLNKKDIGPDHISSIEPHEFNRMVKSVRKVEEMLRPIKNKSDIQNKKFVRKSIVASRLIKKGDIFNEFNITTKRPNLRRSGKKITDILGKVSKKNYSIDDII
jgi:sialic acid synthase SpsE